MKKLILLLSLGLFALNVNGQNKPFTGSVNMNSISGISIDIYFQVKQSRSEILNGPWSGTIIDDAVTSDSLYATWGVATNQTDFKELSITNWPYELGTATNTTGTDTTHGRSANDIILPYNYLVLRLYKAASGVGTVSTDIVNYVVIMNEK